MLSDCEGCKRRREALIAAGKRMAEWFKHPVGPPPVDMTPRPQLPQTNRPALDKDKMDTGG